MYISWPIGTHCPIRAVTSGAYDELAVDDDDEAAAIMAAFANCCQLKSLVNFIYPIINNFFPFLD